MTGILLHEEIRRLVAQVAPLDTVEDEHRRQALTWLDSTSDIVRRIKPRTPSPHLVSYFLLIDHDRGDVLLVDHRRAGLGCLLAGTSSLRSAPPLPCAGKPGRSWASRHCSLQSPVRTPCS
jgi:hypothetical protein